MGGIELSQLGESLFQRQLIEMDRKKRENLLFQIQRLVAERVRFVPIWENDFIPARTDRAWRSQDTP